MKKVKWVDPEASVDHWYVIISITNGQHAVNFRKIYGTKASYGGRLTVSPMATILCSSYEVAETVAKAIRKMPEGKKQSTWEAADKIKG